MAFHSYNYDFNINGFNINDFNINDFNINGFNINAFNINDFNINDFNIKNFNINDFNTKAQDSSLENRLVVFNPCTISSYPAAINICTCCHISVCSKVIA